MFAVYKLTFSNKLPDAITIMNELKQATGLNDLEFISSGKRNYIVFHPLFQKPKFSLDFDIESNEIMCWTTSIKINYLLEATIGVLEKLGGNYEFRINELARDKWENVKDVYQGRNIADLADDDLWAST